MARSRPVSATAKSASTKSASDKKHKHRVGAKSPANLSVGGFLAGLNKTSTKKGKKKSDKPIVMLSGKAEELLQVQQVKATIKTLEGEQKALEAELFPEIEAQRLALCLARREYIGSVNVQADGVDEDGNDVNAGSALYYRQNRFSNFNFFDAASDDELQDRLCIIVEPLISNKGNLEVRNRRDRRDMVGIDPQEKIRRRKIGLVAGIFC